MLPAISTACLYPLETEASLDKLLGLGFRLFEIFVNSESEFSDAFFGGLRRRLGAGGGRVCSVHLYTCELEPLLFFSEYPRRFRDACAQYRRYFARAASVGASYVVFHGDRRGSTFPLEAFCERYASLAAAAREEGVTLAQENVARCRCASAGALRDMRRLLGGDVRFVLDVKQARRAGEDPLALCDAMGRNIALVHLSDCELPSGRDCLLPGDGNADLRRLRERLAANGFDGPMVVEVYRGDFGGDEDLLRARGFLEKLLSPCFFD